MTFMLVAVEAVVMVLVLVVTTTGLLEATEVTVVVVVLIGWTAWRPPVQVIADPEELASSAREPILRCEPPQPLPQEIFTEQLILS